MSHSRVALSLACLAPRAQLERVRAPLVAWRAWWPGTTTRSKRRHTPKTQAAERAAAAAPRTAGLAYLARAPNRHGTPADTQTRLPNPVMPPAPSSSTALHGFREASVQLSAAKCNACLILSCAPCDQQSQLCSSMSHVSIVALSSLSPTNNVICRHSHSSPIAA